MHARAFEYATAVVKEIWLDTRRWGKCLLASLVRVGQEGKAERGVAVGREREM